MANSETICSMALLIAIRAGAVKHVCTTKTFVNDPEDCGSTGNLACARYRPGQTHECSGSSRLRVNRRAGATGSRLSRTMNILKEKSMNGMYGNRRSLVFYVVVFTLILGGLTGISRVCAQDNAQEKDKKEEKKDDKKDEKKGLPLKSDRKINFTTDEGTWLSLDVSPDGKTIGFELIGDIYTLPIEGGKAKLIDGGMAFDSQPKFSPDGQWIAFLSDREGSENIWIMHPDGTGAKQVSKDSNSEFASPSWDPKGKYVYVSKTHFGIGPREIWMYHVDGGTGIQITKSKPTPTTKREDRTSVMGVVASSDGRYLYYAERRRDFSYNSMFPMWQIKRKDRKTGEEDTIIEQPRSAMRPGLTPDGKLLLYVTRHETESGLRLRNLETGEDHWVRYPVTRDDQEAIFSRDLFPGYAFLPGGKEIVYNQDGKIRRLNLESGTETVIPFSAEVSQDLGPKLDFPQRVEQGPVKVRLIHDPAESPDNKKLAFSAMTHLYTLDLPGGKPQRLTAGTTTEFQPAWSPDGKWLAFVSWSSEGGQLWKIPAAGGTPVQLSKSLAVYSNPAFSPDVTKIVFLRGNAYDRENSAFDGGQTGNADLVWISADGGKTNLILPARGAGGPHFTNEKDRIYVYTPGGLVSLRYDGTDRRTHLQVKGQGLYFFEEPIPADDLVPSPDGQWVLAHVQNQLYLLAMPAVGGEAPTVSVGGPSVPLKKITDIGADYFGWADDDKKEEKKPQKFKEQEKDVQEIAIDLELPRKTPKGTIVLRGATVITMKGD